MADPRINPKIAAGSNMFKELNISSLIYLLYPPPN